MTNIIVDLLWSGLMSVLDYLSAHVLTCLIPAFFIAGAIAVLISKEGVIKYFGAQVKKYVSYSIAAVSGTILAVCSCTILPLFGGIYKRGAGIGPATAFLYSGPAINVLAIIYTANLLGWELGAARAGFAITMSVFIGLLMAAIFKRSEARDQQKARQKQKETPAALVANGGAPLEQEKPKWFTAVLFITLVAILIAGTWNYVPDPTTNWLIRIMVLIPLIVVVVALSWKYLSGYERSDWGYETWDLVKKIFPMLILGTFIVGAIAVVLPPETFRPYLGGNSFLSCFLGSVIGSLLYMPTLLEVPIIGTTFGYSSGVMGGGPALSLLLAGPAVSLPSIIVLARLIGAKKTGAFVGLVVLFSTIAGMIYGNFIVG